MTFNLSGIIIVVEKTTPNDITVYFLTREDIFKGRGIYYKQKFGRVIDWKAKLKVVFF